MKMALKTALIGLIASSGFSLKALSQSVQPFSYCSEGECRTITTEYFNRIRGMPLDLIFACHNDYDYMLSFDDGPSANYPALLGILEKHNVIANFFVNGAGLGDKDKISWLQQAYRAGHFIANHTFSHADLTTLNDTQIIEQVTSNREKILEVLKGVSPPAGSFPLSLSTKVLRPPFGNINTKVQAALKSIGMVAVRWNADRYDWKLSGGDSEVIFQRIMEQLSYISQERIRARAQGLKFNSSILDLNHDWQIASLQALDKAIPLIKASGYRFVTLQQCLDSESPH